MAETNFGAEAPRVYLGDHLKTPRLGYSHHGIYAGAGMVIARSREGVCECSMEEFTRGCGFEIVPHNDRAFSRAECVSRAHLMLGAGDYDVAFRNCEHFVTWCITGQGQSTQVQRAAAAALAGIGGAATLAAVLIKHPKAARKAALYAGIPLAGTAGVALRVASLALNTAQAVSTVKALNHIRKTELSALEKTAAGACVIAGVSEERALKTVHTLKYARHELKSRAAETLHEMRERVL